MGLLCPRLPRKRPDKLASAPRGEKREQLWMSTMRKRLKPKNLAKIKRKKKWMSRRKKRRSQRRRRNLNQRRSALVIPLVSQLLNLRFASSTLPSDIAQSDPRRSL